MDWYYERLHGSWTQGFAVEHVHFETGGELQELIIFDNEQWGRVLALDGIIQTTTKDEPHYHEMLVHVPMRSHGQVRDVLIIGGGDGGSLREALRYSNVNVVQVEIDQAVIDMCTTHLPQISNGAFSDPRAEVVIADGAAFVAETDRRFDLIIIDSTDPIGPGEVLFTTEFYSNCRRCLKSGGVFATQLGNPTMAQEELANAIQRMRDAGFAQVDYYLTDVPTYIGGQMSLGLAADNPAGLQTDIAELAREDFDEHLHYYTPAVHIASFAHPAWMIKRFGQ